MIRVRERTSSSCKSALRNRKLLPPTNACCLARIPEFRCLPGFPAHAPASSFHRPQAGTARPAEFIVPKSAQASAGFRTQWQSSPSHGTFRRARNALCIGSVKATWPRRPQKMSRSPDRSSHGHTVYPRAARSHLPPLRRRLGIQRACTSCRERHRNLLKRGMLLRIVIVNLALLMQPKDGTLERMHKSRSLLAITVQKAADPAGQNRRETGRKRHC